MATNSRAAVRQLFVLDTRALDDLHTLAGRLGVNYSHVVREALHLAVERLRQVDQPAALLPDLETEPVAMPAQEGTPNA
jgi:hypothetical protein